MVTALKNAFVFVITVILLLPGCQSTSKLKIDPSLNVNNAALVYVYRPSSDFTGVAIDYRVSANSIGFGSLGMGDTLKTYVSPGSASIHVQPHFLGFADGDGVTMNLMLSQGTTYYIQFNQRFDGITPMGNVTMISGALVLTQLKESQFKGEK